LGLREELRKLRSYSAELGLDLRRPEDRFRWFIASMLFAKRISADIAKKAFRCLMERGLDTPERIVEAGWDALVEALDAGGYVRYDFSTATNILEAAKKLLEEYGGSIDELHERSASPEELEERLKAFRGVGPVAVNIFLRELRGIWPKARPKPSRMALEVAEGLGLSEEEVPKFEASLVRLFLEYCKKRRCGTCPLGAYCRRRR